MDGGVDFDVADSYGGCGGDSVSCGGGSGGGYDDDCYGGQ